MARRAWSACARGTRHGQQRRDAPSPRARVAAVAAAALPRDAAALVITDFGLDAALARVPVAELAAALAAWRGGPLLALGPATPHAFDEPYRTPARARAASRALAAAAAALDGAAFLDVAAATAPRADALDGTGLALADDVADALAAALAANVAG